MSAKQRQYEALRAYFVEGRHVNEVAAAFGYTSGTFRVMCHHFRRNPERCFFVTEKTGPKDQPKKGRAKDLVVAMRKQNHSVYEISEVLKTRGTRLSPTAVRELLASEGFAPLPRRLDEERPPWIGPAAEAIADVRTFSLAPREFTTRCGGLFLFVPDLVRLQLQRLADGADLPGSQMIPNGHALRACLALKLWSLERKSHIMALVADEGLALFSGLNVIPKKSYLSEYSSRIDHKMSLRLLTTWHDLVAREGLFPGDSFNLDFHSVPYYGEDSIIERHFVAMRSRRQKSVLAFLAQDADSRAFCYSNADLRKGEEADEVLRFVDFWKQSHGRLPRHLVFDSKLTTYPKLARLDELGITFLTLRRRSAKLLATIEQLPVGAWRRIELDVPARKYRHPRVYETSVHLAGCQFRQFFIKDLGHDEPTILLTNDRKATPKTLVTRYAQRMLIENALSDAVRFFHMNALSSAVGLKVDFDMALLVVASGLYRLLATRMKGYADAQARQVFRDLLDMPADLKITDAEILVHFHRRAHLPIVMASGMLNTEIQVPWWENRKLRFLP